MDFSLGDSSTKTVHLDDGFYFFVNSHILGRLQITIFRVIDGFNLNINHITVDPSVEISGDTHGNITFVSNGLCDGALYNVKYTYL